MQNQIFTKPHFHPALKADLRVEILETDQFYTVVKLINSKIKANFRGPTNQLKGVRQQKAPAPVQVEKIGTTYRATVFYQSGPITATIKNKILAEEFINAPPEKQAGNLKLARMIKHYVKKQHNLKEKDCKTVNFQQKSSRKAA